MSKKNRRPFELYADQKEFDLVVSLVTMAAGGVLKLSPEWKKVAINYHQHLTNLTLKYVQQQRKDNSAADVLQSGRSTNGDQSRPDGA